MTPLYLKQFKTLAILKISYCRLLVSSLLYTSAFIGMDMMRALALVVKHEDVTADASVPFETEFSISDIFLVNLEHFVCQLSEQSFKVVNEVLQLLSFLLVSS